MPAKNPPNPWPPKMRQKSPAIRYGLQVGPRFSRPGQRLKPRQRWRESHGGGGCRRCPSWWIQALRQKIRQNGNLPQVRGENEKIFELPPPSFSTAGTIHRHWIFGMDFFSHGHEGVFSWAFCWGGDENKRCLVMGWIHQWYWIIVKMIMMDWIPA